LFQDIATGGKCQGCHGGAKWTISRRFYTPAGVTNNALLTTPYDGVSLIAAGFPEALIPATVGNQFMRSPNPKSNALDSMQCLLRPVGTFAVSPVEVNVIELRSDMVTAGQGNETNGKGYNVPSLLGLSVGAPYFHAGNARTLEELLDGMFSAHHGALTLDPGFLTQADDVDAIVAYMLSIDEDTTIIPIPAAAGPDGGDFCVSP
jgi:cytochrome c peroxidase